MADVNIEHIDDVITRLGCGWWQFPILVGTLFACMTPMNFIVSAFLSAPLPFRCSTSDFDSNGTETSLGSIYGYDSLCLLPVDVAEPETFKLDEPLTEEKGSQRYWTGLPSCPVIEYNRSVFTSTIVSEFDLVCENDSLKPLFHVMVSVGSFLGCLVAGQIGDSLGRKRTVQLGVLLGVPASVGMTFLPWYPAILIARIVVGLATRITILPSTSLALETIPLKYRTLFGMYMGIPYCFLVIAFAGAGYVLRSWRLLQLVASLPFILLIIPSLLSDESPRWLVQKGRISEAIEILKKAAKKNNSKLDSFASQLENIKRDAEDNKSNRCCSDFKIETMKKYFKSPAMLIILLVTPPIWFLQNIVYIGITLNVNNFASTNPFLFLALQGVAECIAVFLTTHVTSKIGRKLSICGGYSLAGTFFLLEMAIPADLYWVKWTLVMIAFLLGSGGYQVLYLHAPELFPTVIRTRGFAFVVMVGALGLAATSFITDLLVNVTWWATSVAIGLAGLTAGMLVLLLPETNNLPLPEDIHDVEERHRNSEGVIKFISGLIKGRQSTAAENTA